MNDKEFTSVKKTKKFLLSFLLGGAIGSVIALLYAPKSGKHLRDDISRKTNELIGEGKLKSEHLWDKTKERVENTLDSANDFLSTSKEKIMNKAGKVKDTFKTKAGAYNELKKSGGDESISSAKENESTYNKTT